MGCNFCKEEEVESEQIEPQVQQVKFNKFPSIIKEEDSHFANSSQNSYMRKILDTKSDESVSIYFSQSRITSQNNGSTIKIESNFRIMNYVTQQCLSANLQKCAKLKNCYNVNFANNEQLDNYQQWKFIFGENIYEQKQSLNNGDTVKIKHNLTNNYLCARQSLITKSFEVCTTSLISDECLWIIEIFDKDTTLKQGSYVYLVHMITKKLLSYSKKKRQLLTSQYKILLSHRSENLKQVWRICFE